MRASRIRDTSIAVAIVVTAQLVMSDIASAANPGANGRIAFVRGGDIWTVWPNGAAPKRLTSTHDNSAPAWSPNGHLIAFVSSRAGSADVWVMRTNGSALRRITFAASSNESAPAWSPNGGWIVYAGDRGSTPTLPISALFKRRSAAPYGSPIRLTSPVALGYESEWDYGPAWSPLGGRIMFTRSFLLAGEDADDQLLTVPAGGGEVAPVEASGGDVWACDWAPGGHAFAWTTDVEGDGPFTPPIVIYVRDGDGTVHRVTSTLDATGNPAWSENPAWAPNGERIAYQRGPSYSRTAVWTIRPNGSGNRFVIGNAGEPAWQPLIG